MAEQIPPHPLFSVYPKDVDPGLIERSDRAAEYERLVKAGMLTVDEARKLHGKGPL